MIVRAVYNAFILLIISHYNIRSFNAFRPPTSPRNAPIQTKLLSAIKEKEDVTPKKFTLKSKKRVSSTSIVQYDERVRSNLPTFIYQFNSTTVQAVLNVADKVSSWFTSLESSFESFRITIATKVERDIRITLGTTDFVTRKASKTAQSIKNTLTEVNTPLTLFLLPSNERQGSTRMLTSLKATNTKTRAEQVKKHPKTSISILAVNSALKSVKSLPKQLEYDYRRRVTRRLAEEAGQYSSVLRPDRILSSDVRLKEAVEGNIVPFAVLPASVEVGVDSKKEEEIITTAAAFAYNGDPSSAIITDSTIIAIPEAMEVSGPNKKRLSLSLSDEELLSWQAFTNILTNDQALEKLLFIFSESESYLFDKMEELAANLRSTSLDSSSIEVGENLLGETLTFLEEKESKSETDMQLVLLFRTLVRSADATKKLLSNNESSEMKVVFDSLSKTLSVAVTKATVNEEDCNSYLGINEPSAFAVSTEEDEESFVTKQRQQQQQATAVIIDTEATIEKSVSKSELLVANVLLVIDITFFLVEALIKATIPILTDGGKLALQRIQDTFPVPLALQHFKKKGVSQLYAQFRYKAAVSEKAKR